MSGCARNCLRLLTSAMFCLALLLGSYALAQSTPVSWTHPWHSSVEQQFVNEAIAEHTRKLPPNWVKVYSIAELINVAESNNPETRFAWERARAQAASLSVERGELYPTLAATALSRTTRDEAFFGNRFNAQAEQNFEISLDLNYTILDFGRRRGRIDSAKALLLAANFAFNDTHRNFIYQVEQSYYRLLSSIRQQDAARRNSGSTSNL